MNSELLIYLITIVGVLFHLIVKYRDSYTKSEVFDWKRQIMFTLFSIPTAFILVYFRDVIVNFNGVDLINNTKIINNVERLTQFLSFLIGYFADSIWKNIENTGKTKLKQ